MKRVLDKALLSGKSSKLGKGIDIDISMLLHFEDTRKALDIAMRDCTIKVMQFWGLLLLTHLKIEKMYTLGGQISTAMKKVHDTFNYLVKMFPDHIKSYIIYSSYLKNVANNELESREYQAKALLIKRNVEFMQRESFLDDRTFSINRETAIIIISGNLDTLGLIIHVNEHVHDIFGYGFNEVVGLSVNTIIPKIVAVQHDNYLINFMQKGNSKLVNQETFWFGQCKNGLLVALTAMIRTMPGLNNGLRYVSFIRRDRKSVV